MAEEFPLPGSFYKELIKIIQGYGRIGSEASLSDVAKLTAIGETIVSGNNKFLVAVGIVKGGKRKAITSLGAALATALEHNLQDEISAKWRAVVESTDFLQKVIAAVRIRKGMDESSLESHVAYSAGQPRTPAVATGARAVVEILTAAGLLKEESGTLISTIPEPRPIQETVGESLSIVDPAAGTGSFIHGSLTRSTSVRTSSVGTIQLRVDVTVQCTPTDLDDLGRKLRKMIRDFSEAESSSPNSEAKDTPLTDDPTEE